MPQSPKMAPLLGSVFLAALFGWTWGIYCIQQASAGSSQSVESDRPVETAPLNLDEIPGASLPAQPALGEPTLPSAAIATGEPFSVEPPLKKRQCWHRNPKMNFQDLVDQEPADLKPALQP